MRLVVGTYDGDLMGAVYSPPSTLAGRAATLEPSFALAPHHGSVRCLSAGGPAGDIVVSGGSDMMLHVMALRRNTALGALPAVHRSSINALQWAGAEHLLSGDAGGEVVLWRAADWEPLIRVPNAHADGGAAGVAAVAVHPSARVALTAGRGAVRL